MILPLVGGILMDKTGVKIGLMTASSLVLIGNLVFTIGGQTANFNVMLAGRFIFGLGGEVQYVCKSAIIAMWFKGKELAFAFGVILSFQRMGSVIASIVNPALAKSVGVPETLWITYSFTCFSWLCAVGICLCEMYADKKDGKIGAKLNKED
jgi:MFS family permease